MFKLQYCVLVALSLAASDGVFGAESTQQMAVTLSDSKATMLVDGQLPLMCMTAAMDAAAELGYGGMTVSEVSAGNHKLSPTGVSFFAIVSDDTVTFRSARPIPSNIVICFLQHLRKASIENVRFGSISSESKKKLGEQSVAAESASRDVSTVEDQPQGPGDCNVPRVVE